jgi:hypothetical protein
MDWRDVARERGIPVWAGALFVAKDGRRLRCTDFTEAHPYRPEAVVWSAQTEHDPADCALALDDPDTQPAYLRRLAVRWGAPPSIVAGGIVFAEFGGGQWVLAGGIANAGETFAWRRVLDLGTSDDRLLALALAWPKAAEAEPPAPREPTIGELGKAVGDAGRALALAVRDALGAGVIHDAAVRKALQTYDATPPSNRWDAQESLARAVETAVVEGCVVDTTGRTGRALIEFAAARAAYLRP